MGARTSTSADPTTASVPRQPLTVSRRCLGVHKLRCYALFKPAHTDQQQCSNCIQLQSFWQPAYKEIGALALAQHTREGNCVLLKELLVEADDSLLPGQGNKLFQHLFLRRTYWSIDNGWFHTMPDTMLEPAELSIALLFIRLQLVNLPDWKFLLRHYLIETLNVLMEWPELPFLDDREAVRLVGHAPVVVLQKVLHHPSSPSMGWWLATIPELSVKLAGEYPQPSMSVEGAEPPSYDSHFPPGGIQVS